MPTEKEMKNEFREDINKVWFGYAVSETYYEWRLWLLAYQRGLQAAKEVYAGLKEGTNDK